MPFLHFSFTFFFWANVFVAGVGVDVDVGGSSNCVQFLWVGVGNGEVGGGGTAFMNKRFSSVLRPHAVPHSLHLPPPFPLPINHCTARRFLSIYYAFGLARAQIISGKCTRPRPAPTPWLAPCTSSSSSSPTPGHAHTIVAPTDRQTKAPALN